MAALGPLFFRELNLESGDRVRTTLRLSARLEGLPVLIRRQGKPLAAGPRVVLQPLLQQRQEPALGGCVQVLDGATDLPPGALQAKNHLLHLMRGNAVIHFAGADLPVELLVARLPRPGISRKPQGSSPGRK